MNNEIKIEPIGIIRTPHRQIEGMPVQTLGASGFEGRIILEEKYKEGLKDLDGFSHIILLYRFHKIKDFALQVVPFMDTVPHGIFATRAPKRPNAIGLSIVRIFKIEGNVIYFHNPDMLDGTPLIDIKPFYPKYDNQTDVEIGWLKNARYNNIGRKSDGRFK